MLCLANAIHNIKWVIIIWFVKHEAKYFNFY